VSAGGTADLVAHAANLLGALGLSVTDRTFDAAAVEPGLPVTDAVALSALHQFLDRPTIDLLRRVLGLTSSGAVRLVNRLEKAGLVERGEAEDARATSVVLTAEGRRLAKRVSAARTAVLEAALSGLSVSELRAFDALVSRVLVGLMRGPGATRWMCRFCDMEACGWRESRCPVREASRRR
jgi:DNA-binding MarR family transcriptional regulator